MKVKMKWNCNNYRKWEWNNKIVTYPNETRENFLSGWTSPKPFCNVIDETRDAVASVIAPFLRMPYTNVHDMSLLTVCIHAYYRYAGKGHRLHTYANISLKLFRGFYRRERDVPRSETIPCWTCHDPEKHIDMTHLSFALVRVKYVKCIWIKWMNETVIFFSILVFV